MIETLVIATFNKIVADLNALGMFCFALFVLGEIKAYLTRKRMAKVLDAKDAYSAGVVDRTFTFASTMEKLMSMLETIVRKGS